MQQEPSKLTLVESKKHVQAALRTAFPTLAKTTFSYTSDSRNGNLTLQWPDGPTETEVRAVCERFTRPGFTNRTPFTEDGQAYLSGIRWITYTRYLKREMLTRCATILCRKYQVKLPDILWSSRVGAYVRVQKDVTIEEEDGSVRVLASVITEFAERTNEAELAMLEREADAAYQPLPTFTPEDIQAKEERREEGRRQYAKTSEIERQKAMFCLAVYSRLGLHSSAETMTQGLERLATTRKQVFPQLLAPCVCSYCYHVGEDYQPRGTKYACPECIASGEAERGTPRSQDAAPVQLTEQERRLERDGNGSYIGYNGEPVPILTRDLLHDIRFGKFWLGFAQKPSEAVRGALYNVGWRWGWGKREWYHPNKFATVPQLVIDQFGGYVDGGFSVYREERGERLREYADRVEVRADQREEMSNALVSHYMTTGTLLIGPRRTRSLQKKKVRAERYRQEAQQLDEYAKTLRTRANESEHYQERVTRTPVLQRVIKRLQAESRKLEKHFIESVVSAAHSMHDTAHANYKDVDGLVSDYEEVERRQEVIAEEIEWLEAVITQRRGDQHYKQVTVEAQDVPDAPQRAYAVDAVMEVYVGADNALDLHPTPPTLGDRLLHDPELFSIPYKARHILEPHGGTATLLRRIQAYQEEQNERAVLHTCELDTALHQELQRCGYIVVGTDFLAYTPEEGLLYDAVIMNPPFSAWLAHVKHGYALLAEGGTELAVVPNSFFNDTPEVQEFRALVEEQGAYVKIERGAFRESGTDVPVVLISISK